MRKKRVWDTPETIFIVEVDGSPAAGRTHSILVFVWQIRTEVAPAGYMSQPGHEEVVRLAKYLQTQRGSIGFVGDARARRLRGGEHFEIRLLNPLKLSKP